MQLYRKENLTDRQTDRERETNRQTDRQTDRSNMDTNAHTRESANENAEHQFVFIFYILDLVNVYFLIINFCSLSLLVIIYIFFSPLVSVPLVPEPKGHVQLHLLSWNSVRVSFTCNAFPHFSLICSVRSVSEIS